jgi:hypothetical protein
LDFFGFFEKKKKKKKRKKEKVCAAPLGSGRPSRLAAIAAQQ